MDSSNCLSYKRLVILHKLRCANCVTKILYFFHTTKLSVPVFSNFCLHTDLLFVPNYRIIEFLSSHGISRTVTDFLFFFSCPELSNYRILSSHGVSRTVTDFLFSFLVPNYRIFEFLSSHGVSRTVTDFLSFLSRDLSLDPLTAGR